MSDHEVFLIEVRGQGWLAGCRNCSWITQVPTNKELAEGAKIQHVVAAVLPIADLLQYLPKVRRVARQ